MNKKHAVPAYLPKTYHECKLDPLACERVDLPAAAPYSKLEKIWLKLQRWIIVSHYNPQGKTYFRSSYSLYREKLKQVSDPNIKYIIHPLSRFAMMRELYLVVLWLTFFVLEPYSESFLAGYVTKPVDHYSHHVLIVFNWLILFDVAVQWQLGYTIRHTKEIVLDKNKIAKHYMRRWFLVDVVPCVAGLAFNGLQLDLWGLRKGLHRYVGVVPVYMLRFVRIVTLKEYFANFLCLCGLRESTVKCIKVALCVALFLHWWTCFFYAMPCIRYFLSGIYENSYILNITIGTQRSTASIYLECLLSVVSHFFGASKGNVITTSSLENWILCAILMTGFIGRIVIAATMLQLFGAINISETKYEELYYQLQEYSVTKKLPHSLNKRLLMYYESRFQRQFIKEHLIMNYLSEHLRYEVLLYSCRSLIHKVRLLSGGPKDVVGPMIAMFKHEFFLPNDQVVKLSTVDDNVYFISFGTLAVYSENGKELYHLEDGHHFGEVPILLQDYAERFVVTVTAIETTEVFYLNNKDFWRIVSLYPEIANNLEKTAMNKLIHFSNKINQEESLVDISDIVAALRRKQILDTGRKR